MKPIFLFLTAVTVLLSCDDPINPALKYAAPVYVVDAFVNTSSDKQVIHLTMSQTYFDDTLPPGVSGATVEIQDKSGATLFEFTENPAVQGDYEWTPPQAGAWTVGNTYVLTIEVAGEKFIAESKLGRVPAIDSITFDKSDQPGETDKDFYRAQFWATDPKGAGDTYWIRATKNGVLLDKPSEINLAYDAAFSKGSNFDGFTFIQPIRNGINPVESSDSTARSPYVLGDSVYVQLYSLTEASFDFLNEVAIQTNRPGGFSELFATPLANVSTNIINQTAGGAGVVGFFNTASVSVMGKRFVKK